MSFFTAKKIDLGWLTAFVLMIAISVVGLFVSPGEGIFDMPNDHLYANVAWMITATIFVLMMTPGLSFFYGGMVRVKNVISTMLQSFIVMGFVSVIWVVFGFSLAFGNDVWHVIGNPADFFMFENVGVLNVTDPSREGMSQIGIATTTIPLALFALFQMKFAIITPSLITGSFAERVHFAGYLLFMVLWTVFVYCPLAHCTWHPDGLFAMLHVHDYAGGIVVHAASGIAALAGAIFLGKRSSKRDAKPANVPSAMGAAIGAVVGLVAITPCAGWVTVGQSVFIAFVITICCNMAVSWKSYGQMLDDALDVFPTHGLGGILGTVLTGIFAYDFFAAGDAEMISRTEFFWNHILVLLMVFAYTFLMSYGLYWITNKLVPLRVSRRSEEIGLDRSQHDEEYGIEGVTGLAEDTPTVDEWFRGMEES